MKELVAGKAKVLGVMAVVGGGREAMTSIVHISMQILIDLDLYTESRGNSS